MSAAQIEMPNPCDVTVCDQFPELKRLNYCHGQMLGAQDFVDEQIYYLNKIALLTRCLDGFGVVCGLTVDLKRDEAAAKREPTGEAAHYRLDVSCGVAVDPRGRELVMRVPIDDKWSGARTMTHEAFMSEADRQWFVSHTPGTEFSLYVTIEYHAHLEGEHPLPHSGCCGKEGRTIHNRWHEQPCIRITQDAPPPQTCDSCCKPLPAKSGSECPIENRVWLAELRFRGAPFPDLVGVYNTIRRPVTTYQPTRVKELNWIHTGIYEENLAECLLQDGLTMTFTAPIDPQSIKNHDVRFTDFDDKREIVTNDIVEVWVCDEHRISHGSMQVLQSEIEILSPTQIKVKVRPTQLSPPQRVLVRFRSDFVLDHCCQPIDGNHRGGFVPFGDWEHGRNTHPTEYARAIAEYEDRFRFKTEHCKTWLQHRPRTSGNGTPGGAFESWFYVVGGGCLRKYDAQIASAQ